MWKMHNKNRTKVLYNCIKYSTIVIDINTNNKAGDTYEQFESTYQDDTY